jgi:hypothetical protein
MCSSMAGLFFWAQWMSVEWKGSQIWKCGVDSTHAGKCSRVGERMQSLICVCGPVNANRKFERVVS